LLNRAKRAHPLPDSIDVVVGAHTVPVRLRIHPRARRYLLRVGAGTPPVVTVPPGGSLVGAQRFLAQHSTWLFRRLERRPQARPFVPGGTVPLRGVDHEIVRGPDHRGTVAIGAGPSGPILAVAGRPEHLPRRLTDWLIAQARADLEEAVFRYAAMVKRKPTAIRLRDTKGRWGSCSSRGLLSFSWRLILAPAFVLDYLAAHEVAHLRELHHGAAFWRLLRRICPETDRAEAWLKAYGSALHAIGAGEPENPTADAVVRNRTSA
jgi:hypothetical protein